MIYILILCALSALIFAEVRHTDILTAKKDGAMYLPIVICAFAVVYLVCSAVYRGHQTDMSCFSAWSEMVFSGGIKNFYVSEAFHDYPPGYMYVLYFIGALKSLFGISGTPETVLLKLPSLLCNIGSGYLIYKIARKKCGDRGAAAAAAMYLFNPAVITNGAVWGQVDAVYTLALMYMIYLLSSKRMPASYFAFALAVLIKPQSLIFTPLLILGIIENLFINDFDRKRVLKNLACGLSAIAALVLAAVPFGLKNVIGQYITTISEQYPYFTVNAFNLWGMLGMNWKSLNTAGTAAGYVFVAAIAAYSSYVFLKSKSSAKYWYVGALLSFMTYMFSVKMHDRYSFPALLFVLAAYTVNGKGREYLLYSLLTVTHFFNEAWTLFVYETNPSEHFQSPVVTIASAVNVAAAVYMIYAAYKYYAQNKESKNNISKKKASEKQSMNKSLPHKAVKCRISPSERPVKLTRLDIIAMLVITLVYGAIALYDLGDKAAPETETIIASSPVTIDLGGDTEISSVKYYLGARHLDETRRLDIEYVSADGTKSEKRSESSASVFCWNESSVDLTARYIILSSSKEVSIKELCITAADGNTVLPSNYGDVSAAAMFDEQSLIPERASFRNSTYFDEIYHARTAYEFIHHDEIYEWTHPPLGKLIIALGIMIFGMCPFGWRIAGAVFGIMMVPLIYMFAKCFFKRSRFAVAACLLFTFDFMHFAQTRIATIDVYVTFFIILMYYFMYRYVTMSFYDTPLKKTLIPPALCGISMGLGIACKWTGVYAGAGLAVLFFLTLGKRYREYRCALLAPDGETEGISHERIIKSFKPYTVKTLAWCCVFFVAVPILIYCLSYIPYMLTPSGEGLKTVISNMKEMYTYHAKTVLGATHPYSSVWYQWPVMYRPIWLYSGTVSDGIKEGISSFGNPAVWWGGIAAFIYMIYRVICKKDKKALFLVIAYLAQLIPWIPVSRLTFIYHYFPSVPFVVLMIGYSICTLHGEAAVKCGKGTAAYYTLIYGAAAYVLIAVVLFAMFYPVLSGQPCAVDYVSNWLRWFSTWALI